MFQIVLENCKQKLESGEYSPIVYLYSIANSIHIDTNSLNGELQNDSSSEFEEDNEEHNQNAICCVCLLPRESTVVFLPCRHAKCCEECSTHLEKCPICRCTVEDRFNIFTTQHSLFPAACVFHYTVHIFG